MGKSADAKCIISSVRCSCLALCYKNGVTFKRNNTEFKGEKIILLKKKIMGSCKHWSFTDFLN